ncbi:unnamed protein product [Schistosoma rodhaini]|uniref:MRN complex-interacting protein N-terminal domain-containing protein n=1 Tax=Schistosoma rodhaini TaxID=6188 RepID=A0AA85EW44_9TREM|nr:unnamed protein product [Schistosoma rodhaini]
MPVQFWVLCCSKCCTFQVHHRIKSKTWVCKVCSCKQSVLKVFAEGIAQECRKVVQKLNRQGVLRQMNLHEYGLLNHPRAPQSSSNIDLSGKTMPTKNSLSKDEITSAQDIDTADSNECLTVESQEISYRLYPYSKTSGSQTKMNTSNPKDILVPNSTVSSQTSPFLPPDKSNTDSSQKFISKWDIYL